MSASQSACLLATPSRNLKERQQIASGQHPTPERFHTRNSEQTDQLQLAQIEEHAKVACSWRAQTHTKERVQRRTAAPGNEHSTSSSEPT